MEIVSLYRSTNNSGEDFKEWKKMQHQTSARVRLYVLQVKVQLFNQSMMSVRGSSSSSSQTRDFYWRACKD